MKVSIKGRSETGVVILREIIHGMIILTVSFPTFTMAAPAHYFNLPTAKAA
jgi:hypothetical protein